MKRDGKVYKLASNKTPLNFMLQATDKKSKALLFYDGEANEGRGAQRALRYAPNQRSIFIDEQQEGIARVGTIIFKDGVLFVSNREPLLMEFLKHHPGNAANKGGLFVEVDHSAENEREIEMMDFELEARMLAKDLSMNEMVTLMRKLKPSEVDKMDSSEIKRDVKVFAKNNPHAFMDMVEIEEGEDATDDLVSQALDQRLIQFRNKKTQVFYTLEDKKTMFFKVPEGKNPEKSLREFLMTNEGIEIYKELEGLLD
jgi:hypothetical protein